MLSRSAPSNAPRCPARSLHASGANRRKGCLGSTGNRRGSHVSLTWPFAPLALSMEADAFYPGTARQTQWTMSRYWPCPFSCITVCPTAKELVRHICTRHGDEGFGHKFRCPVASCRNQYPREDNMFRHFKVTHRVVDADQDQPPRCSHCLYHLYPGPTTPEVGSGSEPRQRHDPASGYPRQTYGGAMEHREEASRSAAAPGTGEPARARRRRQSRRILFPGGPSHGAAGIPSPPQKSHGGC